MNGKHYVGLDLTGFEDNGQARPISRVTLMVDDDNAVTAGDDTGVELAAECPHATQAMVNAILKSVKGYAYKMYSAAGASLDPAAELGDGITAGGVYSVIAAIDDDGTYPDVAAPGEQEMEDEYPTEGPVTRRFNRQIADTRSSITKTAEQIRLEVEKAYATKGELGAAESRLSSSITQTAESIASEVKETYATKTALSSVEQTADKIAWLVKSGTSESNFTLTDRAAKLVSDVIDLTGYVTFNSLKTKGSTEINGANIQTGTVTADKISVKDLSALDATIGGWTIDDGLNYDDGTNRFIIRPKGSETSNLILYAGYKGDNGSYTYPFAVNKDGHLRASDAEIAGKITATEGKIGGFTIDSSAIYDDDHSSLVGDVRLSKTMFTRTIGGTERTSLRFAIGENFAVNNNGVVYASNVHLKGEVTATSGAIGGWNIGSNGISYTSEDKLHLVTVRPIQNSASLPVIYIGRREKETDGWSIPFRVNGDGTCSATDFKISGGSTFSGGLDGATGSISGVTGSVSGLGGSVSGLTGSVSGLGGSITGMGGSFGGTVSSGVLSGCNLGGTNLGGGNGNASVVVNGLNSAIGLYGASYATMYSGGGTRVSTTYNVQITGNTAISGSLSCTGDKDRAIQTKNYGIRCLSALETPIPTFSDYGTGEIDEYGLCYIEIDPIFSETVTSQEPSVLLTKYGEGDIWVKEVSSSEIIVAGTPGLRFSWESKHTQANTYANRLKQIDFGDGDKSHESDFMEDAITDIQNSTPNLELSAWDELTRYASAAVDYGQAGYEYYTEFERRLTA